MTTPLTFPDKSQGRSVDRRTLLKGAAALTATGLTMQAAAAATVTPFGQTGAPTTSTDPLPLGPLSGSRYPDSHLESLKKPKVSFGPAGFPAFAGTMAVERVATGFRWAEGPVYFRLDATCCSATFPIIASCAFRRMTVTSAYSANPQ
jgi:gluconolactonase